ncbi:MAG: hypothetical protein CMM93_02145 [Rickettsiales bacterium]|nr:hypothetical protein [Rickettsiales bacterium]|tara:strand:+ start:117 stop:404 length:288 start_codon:yes stop_codon:yes gene_type:complete
MEGFCEEITRSVSMEAMIRQIPFCAEQFALKLAAALIKRENAAFFRLEIAMAACHGIKIRPAENDDEADEGFCIDYLQVNLVVMDQNRSAMEVAA